jgi:hypothetical protein
MNGLLVASSLRGKGKTILATQPQGKQAVTDTKISGGATSWLLVFQSNIRYRRFDKEGRGLPDISAEPWHGIYKGLGRMCAGGKKCSRASLIYEQRGKHSRKGGSDKERRLKIKISKRFLE